MSSRCRYIFFNERRLLKSHLFLEKQGWVDLCAWVHSQQFNSLLTKQLNCCDKFKMKGKWKVLWGPAAGHGRGIKAKSKGQEQPGEKPRIRARNKYLSQDVEGEGQLKQLRAWETWGGGRGKWSEVHFHSGTIFLSSNHCSEMVPSVPPSSFFLPWMKPPTKGEKKKWVGGKDTNKVAICSEFER